MEDLDIRWHQRFQNYCRALAKLNEAADVLSRRLDYGTDVGELLHEGLIQRFEYTHELAWNVMKDYAEYQGITDVRGSRDAIRHALQMNLISDKAWMKSIEDRNLSSHGYDSATAESIMLKIVNVYIPLFNKFEQSMKQIGENL